MNNTPLPTSSQPGVNPLPVRTTTQQNRRTMVRRARIEHLALELLRLADAVRLPVPVDSLWRFPPSDLWPAPAVTQQTIIIDPDNPYLPRYITAREIARALGESAWEAKKRLLGNDPLSDDETHMFAVALLMPTPLFTNLSERQKQPHIVASIFQVPQPLAETRLRDLGYLK
jgi:hypothetical protein